VTDINRLLRDLGMSPAELARRLGVSEAAVSRWRSGRNQPQGLYAARLAELAATAQLRRVDGPELPTLVAGLLEHAAPLPGPDAPDYQRGYAEGYRAALQTMLGAIAAPYRAIAHYTEPPDEHDHRP
jgi:transcriptional regulator with XRE-family HTH domain